MEISANGENCKDPDSGDSISNAARRQTASLGMIRLEMMPTIASREPSVNPLICSSQPPRNATPSRPRVMTPLVSVENQVPNTNVTDKATMHSKKTSSAPRTGCCAMTPPIQYPSAIAPQNMIATYVPAIATKPNHLPIKIC